MATKSGGRGGKSKGGGGGKDRIQASEDSSILNQPMDTSINGLTGIANALHHGTKELQTLLTNECKIIYECLVCTNLFRTLPNFLAHKRIYCRELFMNRQAQRLPKVDVPSVCIIQPEPMVLPNHVSIPPPSDPKKKKTILGLVESLPKEKMHPVICLERLNEDTVYQTFDSDNRPSIRKEYEEVQSLTRSDRTAVLGPDGKVVCVTNEVNASEVLKVIPPIPPLSSPQEGVKKKTDIVLKCNACGMTFSSAKTLKTHVNNIHVEYRKYFPCPCCKQSFPKSWSVYRHLIQVHRKSEDQVHRLKARILKSVFKKKYIPPALSEETVVEKTEKVVEEENNEEEKKEEEKEVPKKSKKKEFKWGLRSMSGGRQTHGDYACHKCDVRFSSSGDLIQHERKCWSQSNGLEDENVSSHESDNESVISSAPLPTGLLAMSQSHRDSLGGIVTGSANEKRIGIQIRRDYAKVKTSPPSGDDKLPEPQRLNSVMESHMKQFINATKLQCLPCSQKFHSMNNLQRHVAMKHLHWDRYVCTLCNGFKHFSKYECELHVSKSHPEAKGHAKRHVKAIEMPMPTQEEKQTEENNDKVESDDSNDKTESESSTKSESEGNADKSESEGIADKSESVDVVTEENDVDMADISDKVCTDVNKTSESSEKTEKDSEVCHVENPVEKESEVLVHDDKDIDQVDDILELLSDNEDPDILNSITVMETDTDVLSQEEAVSEILTEEIPSSLLQETDISTSADTGNLESEVPEESPPSESAVEIVDDDLLEAVEVVEETNGSETSEYISEEELEDVANELEVKGENVEKNESEVIRIGENNATEKDNVSEEDKGTQVLDETPEIIEDADVEEQTEKPHEFLDYATKQETLECLSEETVVLDSTDELSSAKDDESPEVAITPTSSIIIDETLLKKDGNLLNGDVSDSASPTLSPKSGKSRMRRKSTIEVCSDDHRTLNVMKQPVMSAKHVTDETLAFILQSVARTRSQTLEAQTSKGPVTRTVAKKKEPKFKLFGHNREKRTLLRSRNLLRKQPLKSSLRHQRLMQRTLNSQMNDREQRSKRKSERGNQPSRTTSRTVTPVNRIKPVKRKHESDDDEVTRTEPPERSSSRASIKSVSSTSTTVESIEPHHLLDNGLDIEMETTLTNGLEIGFSETHDPRSIDFSSDHSDPVEAFIRAFDNSDNEDSNYLGSPSREEDDLICETPPADITLTAEAETNGLLSDTETEETVIDQSESIETEIDQSETEIDQSEVIETEVDQSEIIETEVDQSDILMIDQSGVIHTVSNQSETLHGEMNQSELDYNMLTFHEEIVPVPYLTDHSLISDKADMLRAAMLSMSDTEDSDSNDSLPKVGNNVKEKQLLEES